MSIAETIANACGGNACSVPGPGGGPGGGKKPMLSPNTKVNLTLAAVASAAFSVIVGTVWVVNFFNGLNARNDALGSRIDNLATQIADWKDNGYTKTAAAEIALRNAVLNPGIYYADPRNPSGNPIYVDPGRMRSPGTPR